MQPNNNLICIYGVGKGEHYLELQAWLSQNLERQLIFIEDENAACEGLMGIEWGRELLSHPQVRLFSLAVSEEESVFAQIAWECLFAPFDFIAHAAKDTSRAKQISEKLSRMHMQIQLIASDYRDLGTCVLGNAYSNLKRAPEAIEGKELFEKFKGIPAIICGAGPSLAKNIDVLKTLQDRALIFAAGSAVNILSHHGISPHFSASFDPDHPYHRFYQQTHFETPFFYQHRLSKELLSLVHAPLLLMSANGSYPIEAWLERKLGIDSEAFDSGWTAANFCTAISGRLGCSPIIFVGLDLCFSEGKKYASGVESPVENAISAVNKKGDPVSTQKDWLMSKEWMESFACSQSEKIFLNATEGGMGFAGISDLTLNEVKEQYLARSRDLKGYIHATLGQLKRIQASTDDVEGILNEMQASLSRCGHFCNQMIEQHRLSYPASPESKGEYVLQAFELQEETAFQNILHPLWDIWKHSILRKSQQHPELHKLLFFKRVIHD